MPEAIFYTHLSDIPLFTARLCRRILAADKQILLWTEDRAAAAQWDGLLWQIPPESFLPHEIGGLELLPTSLPLLIACGQIPDDTHQRIILNFSPSIWPTHSTATRLIEIIGCSEAELAAARTRFSHYRRQGFTLLHHNMNGRG